MIEVSGVKFNSKTLEKGLVGFASCVINEGLYLGNIAVFSKLNEPGYRLVFPIRKSTKGMQFKICFPINDLAYQRLLDAITKEINKI